MQPFQVASSRFVYADLPVQVVAENFRPILGLTFMLWMPRQVCDAANDSRLLLHREIVDLVQRNLNAGFSLLKRAKGLVRNTFRSSAKYPRGDWAIFVLSIALVLVVGHRK